MTHQPSFNRQNYSGKPATHERFRSGRARLKRCHQAAARRKLVLKVDFGESMAFCDARYGKHHELHEILRWSAEDLRAVPGLFEGVIKSATRWDAQFIYTVHEPFPPLAHYGT